jgi:hypothetical protein
VTWFIKQQPAASDAVPTFQRALALHAAVLKGGLLKRKTQASSGGVAMTRSPDDWELLDEMLAVIRRGHYPAGETLGALTTCMAKVIVMAAADDQDIAQMIEMAGRGLSTAVDFQKRGTGEGG